MDLRLDAVIEPCGNWDFQGNGMAAQATYITVDDRRIFGDTEARGSQREGV